MSVPTHETFCMDIGPTFILLRLMTLECFENAGGNVVPSNKLKSYNISASQTVSRGSLGSRGFLLREPRTITIFHNYIFFIHNFLSVRSCGYSDPQSILDTFL